MKLPSWFRQEIPNTTLLKERTGLFRDLKLNTVCQSAHCPNLGDCFSKNQATFMILGNNCSRNCRFCAVENTNPQEVDPFEPQNVAQAVKKLGLDYIVITSVTRDDLEDGGVEQFAQTIKAIRNLDQNIKVEVLIPDFKINVKECVFNADRRKSNADGRRFSGFNLRVSALDPRESALRASINLQSLKLIIKAGPSVIGHNIETVPRLYPKARPQADYNRSIALLRKVKEISEDILTKSGIMLGLGETFEDILGCFDDLARVNCDILALGQYLAPSEKHLPVEKFYSPQEFEELKQIALVKGFKNVISGPLVRSSYKAKEVFEEITECMMSS